MNEIIEEFINKINKTIDINEYAFDIKKIIEGLGGTIIKEKVPVGESAVIKSINKAGVYPLFTIAVTNDDIDIRVYRSILAKLLGHLFIHLELLNEEAWDKHVDEGKELLELLDVGYNAIEANIFGILFLLPKDKFLKVAGKCIEDDHFNLDKIADTFNVSYNYVYNRGKSLGLWY